MKIVYRKKITEELDDAIRISNTIGKEIEKFILTKREFYELTLVPHRDDMCYMYNGYLVVSE
jgi:hypothetical protein